MHFDSALQRNRHVNQRVRAIPGRALLRSFVKHLLFVVSLAADIKARDTKQLHMRNANE